MSAGKERVKLCNIVVNSRWSRNSWPLEMDQCKHCITTVSLSSNAVHYSISVMFLRAIHRNACLPLQREPGHQKRLRFIGSALHVHSVCTNVGTFGIFQSKNLKYNHDSIWLRIDESIIHLLPVVVLILKFCNSHPAW